ncbi:MAG: hypothetical protein JOY64_03935 [Alphaproteobacteria bacterium]|nr:hypothetical protein [Alphaproteobacteria bacterium]MBV8406756.1 hypothetical protein [Alphaproteobacteria bacterium]
MESPERPTACREQHAATAHNYCLLGATDDQLAGFFQVSRRTLDDWLLAHPGFARAVRDGRAAADAAMARRLFQRAMGYDYATEKIFIHDGKALQVKHTVHVPPDVRACLFWLRNRRRRDWLERTPAPEPNYSPAPAEGDTP